MPNPTPPPSLAFKKIMVRPAISSPCFPGFRACCSPGLLAGSCFVLPNFPPPVPPPQKRSKSQPSQRFVARSIHVISPSSSPCTYFVVEPPSAFYWRTRPVLWCGWRSAYHCHTLVVSKLKWKNAPPWTQFEEAICPWGVFPIMAYTGKLRPKGGPFSGFSRPQVYKRVWISQGEKVRNSVL